MKRYLTEVLAFLIGLFVLFGAGGCAEMKTEWRGVREGLALECASTSTTGAVYLCIASDGSLWTCVERRARHDLQIRTCAEQAAPPPAEARR
jgi:hypothetical protein